MFYPIILAYLYPSAPFFQDGSGSNTEGLKAFALSIPQLGITSPIIEDVDPWDSAVYREALSRGVAHAKGTPLPGQAGSVYVFAHSSDAPWRLSRYNTLFFRLGELQKDDWITISREGVLYEYRVTEKKTVWPSDVNVLLSSMEEGDASTVERLILQTCTPLGTDWKRLLVFAERVAPVGSVD